MKSDRRIQRDWVFWGKPRRVNGWASLYPPAVVVRMTSGDEVEIECETLGATRRLRGKLLTDINGHVTIGPDET